MSTDDPGRSGVTPNATYPSTMLPGKKASCFRKTCTLQFFFPAAGMA